MNTWRKHILLPYALLIIVGAWLPNTLLWVASMSLLLAIVLLTFQPGTPNFFFWGLLMQWISVSIEPIVASIRGIPIEDFFTLYSYQYISLANIENAFLWSMAGVFFFTLGIHRFQKAGVTVITSQDISKASIQFHRLAGLYISYSIFTFILQRFLFTLPGISQILSFLILLKWGFFYTTMHLGFLVFKERKNWMLLIIVLDIFLGLGSFFAASIANIFLFLFFARLATLKRISVNTVVVSSLFLIFILNFAIIWTAVKQDYRLYLTGGERTQIVTVEKGAAIEKLGDLASNLDAQQYQHGIDGLIHRLGYVVFFSKVLEYVPEIQPHENGKVITDAFVFYLIPRLFYAEKPIIDDSEHTRKYTGVMVAGSEAGTSISLGYIADAYIDFGIPFMFLSIFFLAWFNGWVFKTLNKNCPSIFWQFVFSALFYFSTNVNSINTIKIVGPLLINLILGIVFLRFLAPPIERFLRAT